METKNIQIQVYKFNELSERVQQQVKRRLLMYFKDRVKEDTLFLSSGYFFTEQDLNFIGLKNCKIEENI